MIHRNKKNTKFDIAVVGAGPTGVAFACGFVGTNIKVAIIDKLPREVIANPKIDGREIALTHHSVKILKKLNVWRYISNKSISVIKEARVLDGDSKYFLNFDHQEIQKDCLGYLIPNHIIRKNLYKRLKNFPNITFINKTECLSVNINSQYALITLSNGEKIKTSLVVAADSRFSKMRSKMGISAFTRDFNKNMIVCRMQHEKPHKNIAYEFFRYNQTQATLPYIKNQSGIVTTATKDLTSTLMKMDKKKFNKMMKAYPEEFSFMRHETTRSLRPSKITKVHSYLWGRGSVTATFWGCFTASFVLLPPRSLCPLAVPSPSSPSPFPVVYCTNLVSLSFDLIPAYVHRRWRPKPFEIFGTELLSYQADVQERVPGCGHTCC